jgi:hypothetical protein
MQLDKFKHAIVSCALVLVLSLYFTLLWAVILTLTLGLMKEFNDPIFDVYDIMADIAGIIIGVLVCL